MTTPIPSLSSKELIERKLAPGLMKYLNKTLLPRLAKHIKDTIGPEQLRADHSDLVDLMDQVRQDLKTPEIQGNFHRLLSPMEMGIPSLVYWKLQITEAPQIPGLKDLIIPIGTGFNQDLQTEEFYMDLTGQFHAYVEDDWFIALPILNGMFSSKADMRSLLEITPDRTVPRHLMFTYYTHVSDGEEGFIALEPGIYQAGEIAFRGRWGIHQGGQTKASDLIPIKGVYLYLNDDVVSFEEAVGNWNASQHVYPVVFEEEEIQIVGGPRLPKDWTKWDQGLVHRSDLYTRYQQGQHQPLSKPDEELQFRKELREYDILAFPSRLHALKAIETGEIHDLLDVNGKAKGIRYLDILGFTSWYQKTKTEL